ncbi:hypothetical protein PG984_003262 [Apiospora sp. TS-2023a]
MCKRYIYLSLCIEHDCDSIIGEKGRNTYCRPARHGRPRRPRRLGSCDSGLEYFIASRHRGTVLCTECKQLRVLRQLSESVSTGKGEGECQSTGGDEVVLGDDGGSSSSCETIRGGDEVDTGPLRFFATKKEKNEKFTSAYDFDLALEQEIARLDIKNTRVASTKGEEEDAYLSITGTDDSTIEYENKVPEATRHKGLSPSLRDYYYGFAAVGVEEERISPRPRPQPQPRPQYVEEEVQWVKKTQAVDDPYDSDTTATAVVMTPSGSESESEADANINCDLRSGLEKVSSRSEAASDTLVDAESLSSDGEPEFNDKLNFQLRPDVFSRTCVDRVDGRDVRITPTNPRRVLIAEKPLATDARSWSEDEDDWPTHSGDRSNKDSSTEKGNKSHRDEKDDDGDDKRDNKRAPLSFWEVVLDDRTKRQRTV